MLPTGNYCPEPELWTTRSTKVAASLLSIYLWLRSMLQLLVLLETLKLAMLLGVIPLLSSEAELFSFLELTDIVSAHGVKL